METTYSEDRSLKQNSEQSPQVGAPVRSKTHKTRPVTVGPYVFGDHVFAVIAGPCSIESESQFLQTAEAVKAAGACLLRGGIWKMRTSVKAFQGLGQNSLSMISQVLEKTQMSLVSEVTDPRQIAELDSVVSMYQVGSRNMHNYALLKELGQTKKPVLLKRGFAALVDEWIKAAEYVTTHGNPNVILCERGIRTFETATRNTLDLNAVAYVKHNTDLPVIVDPSHAVGIRELIPDLALAAAACGADGIIVEVHPRPEEALSDGMQALRIGDFQQMMRKLERVLAAIDRPLMKHQSVAQPQGEINI